MIVHMLLAVCTGNKKPKHYNRRVSPTSHRLLSWADVVLLGIMLNCRLLAAAAAAPQPLPPLPPPLPPLLMLMLMLMLMPMLLLMLLMLRLSLSPHAVCLSVYYASEVAC
jgi:hypothetical protein